MELDRFARGGRSMCEVSHAIYVLHERGFLEAQKVDGAYYIGRQRLEWEGYAQRHRRLLSLALSPAALFAFPFAHVRHYSQMYCDLGTAPGSAIEIMQVRCEDLIWDEPDFSGVFVQYAAVLKTHWLRLVQRRWRAVLRARNAELALRRTPRYRRHMEERGRYPPRAPGGPPLALRGMLADLAR